MGGVLMLLCVFLVPLFVFVVASAMPKLKLKKYQLRYGIVFLCTFIVGMAALFSALKIYLRPMVMTQEDIYGSYVIDRDKFSGEQADWQYANFRFRITRSDELLFEYRLYEDNWKMERVKLSYSSGYYDPDKEQYCNKRIRIYSDSTNHHIIRAHPTLYRQNLNRFYYVFKSEKFGNVFFKKGSWNE